MDETRRTRRERRNTKVIQGAYMLILGIESSCDETGAALVRDGRVIVANALASQAEVHARYGGVVPEVAARAQLSAVIPVMEMALIQAGIGWNDVDAVAATYGPGLAGPLLVGLTAAKTVAFARKLPFIGINHLEAHIYANWLIERAVETAPGTQANEFAPRGVPPQSPPAWTERSPEPLFPLLSLLVSGAHSELIVIRAHGDYQLLGQTRDDAAGEAFDKVARLLGLAYPGGPSIQRAAAEWPVGQPLPLRLPRAWLRGTHDFSFSGIKTAVMHLVERARAAHESLNVPAIAAAFQEAVVDVLATKTVAAAKAEGAAEVALAGGVAANLALRQRLARDLRRANIPFRYPPVALCTDNAAMIAGAAYFHLQRGERSDLTLDVMPGLALPTSTRA
jgi:N6-L-threonylcarbamoyladenine synthase